MKTDRSRAKTLIRRIADTANRSRRETAAAIALVAVLLLAGGYVVIGALKMNPVSRDFAVRLLMPESGGLLANQDVTLRGIPVGRVESVGLTTSGVEAVIVLHGDSRIPRDSPVRISALSAAGEQFVDFQPRSTRGPYLGDGDQVRLDKGDVPTSLARLLQDARGFSAQLDSKKLAAIMTELRVSREGPRKLAAILDGGVFLASTLDAVLPETVSVLQNSRVVFGTVSDLNAGLDQTTDNLNHILAGISRMDNGFRTFVDRGPDRLATVDSLVDDNRANALALLGNLTTTAQMMYPRVPALKALFPPDRPSVVDSFGSIFHQGAMWGLIDVYPRYGCDYDVPRLPSVKADFPEPFLYAECKNHDPSVLVRGARNAPRPPGAPIFDGPPPGANPLATTDPAPTLANSMPLPYGGPVLPAVLPP